MNKESIIHYYTNNNNQSKHYKSTYFTEVQTKNNFFNNQHNITTVNIKLTLAPELIQFSFIFIILKLKMIKFG